MSPLDKLIIKTIKCTDFIRHQSEFYLQQMGTIKYISRLFVSSRVLQLTPCFLHTGHSEPTPLQLPEGGLIFVELFFCGNFSFFFFFREVFEKLLAQKILEQKVLLVRYVRLCVCVLSPQCILTGNRLCSRLKVKFADRELGLHS